jgi:hypothetical protein
VAKNGSVFGVCDNTQRATEGIPIARNDLKSNIQVSGDRARDQELKIKFSRFVKLPASPAESDSGAGGKKNKFLFV